MKAKVKIKSEKGQAIVEMALVLPLLLLIVMGIIEFGFMFNSYLTVTNASRESARYVSLGGDEADGTVLGKNVSAGLNTDNMTFTYYPDTNDRNRGDSVTVTVHYNYEFITPFIGAIIGPNLDLASETVMRVE